MRLYFVFICLFSIVACGTNRLDDFTKGRIERNELILVYTDNEGFLDLLIDELFFGWVKSNENRSLSVEIESIDKVLTNTGLLDNDQKYALSVGHHTLNISCELSITYDGDDNSYLRNVSYSNKDVIELILVPGYEYKIKATDENTSCNFKVQELRISK